MKEESLGVDGLDDRGESELLTECAGECLLLPASRGKKRKQNKNYKRKRKRGEIQQKLLR